MAIFLHIFISGLAVTTCQKRKISSLVDFEIFRTLTAHRSLTVAPRALKIEKSSSLAWNSLLNGLSSASLAALFAELHRFSQRRPESCQFLKLIHNLRHEVQIVLRLTL